MERLRGIAGNSAACSCSGSSTRRRARTLYHTGPEALWWGIVTITTVGYGDYYPVTYPGQVVGSITMLIGIALIGTFTGYLANTFLSPRSAASPSDDDDPRSQLEIVRRQLEENARAAAELQNKLRKIVSALYQQSDLPATRPRA